MKDRYPVDPMMASVAKNKLFQHAGKRDPMAVLWENKKSGKRYRLTRRRGVYVYALWESFGKSSVNGQRISLRYTVGEFLGQFKAIS